jgi:hypothetical protein
MPHYVKISVRAKNFGAYFCLSRQEQKIEWAARIILILSKRLVQLFRFFVDGCYKNCDKVFLRRGAEPLLNPLKSEIKQRPQTATLKS